MLQPNKNEIYQLTYTVDEKEGESVWGCCRADCSELPKKNDFSQINSQTRIKKSGFGIDFIVEKAFQPKVEFIVDPGFIGTCFRFN